MNVVVRSLGPCLRNLVFLLLLLLTTMTAAAGNFFPPEYKRFTFKAGDLLVTQRCTGNFSVTKVLRVDRIEVKRGSSINIRGQRFVATEDDFMLVVSTAYGGDEFQSFEQALAAAQAGAWRVKMRHNTPSRTTGAEAGQTLVGHAAVADSELDGYRIWRAAFDRGEAGVF